MKTRTVLILGATLAVVGGLWLAGPAIQRWRRANLARAQARAFWERFCATNSAWLNPQPPSMYYELILQKKERDYADPTKPREYWRDTSLLKTWYTPEKNLRVIEQYLDRPATNYNLSEYRYFHGRGGRVSLKPRGRQRELGTDLWLAGRTGCGFLSVLHLLARWGLPPTAFVQSQPDSTSLFSLTNLSRTARVWRRETMVAPAYGLHPAVFDSQTEVYPDRVELQVNSTTLLPAAVDEKDERGKTMAHIVFEEPWLELLGRPVPRAIRCELPRQEYSVRYEFQVAEGVWLLKECVRTNASAYSLCRRSFLRALKVGPLADELFPGMADLEIPEHSVTSLGPGERLLNVRTPDGLSLEAKLSLPPAASGPGPVVFLLPGAGPWTFDRPLVYPDLEHLQDMMPQMKVYNYCDFFARELAKRGIGFFRMNKRGCGIVRNEQGYPQEIVNRSVFCKATPTVLLADYRAALELLRRQPDVDPDRIVLLGASEGTRLAPRLALAEPAGLAAVALIGYSEDSMKDTVLWQHTVGPWRNIAKIFDANDDQKVTRAEYDEVVRLKGRIVSDTLPFDRLDQNGDGSITPDEMNQRASAEEIFKAVRQREDEFLYDNLLCLSSAYLLEEWEAPPTHETLLRLDLPLAIFHGENDGACRVEGVRETAAAFVKAAKTNLTVHIYPKTDHNLNWPSILRDGKTPKPFNDLFDFIVAHAGRPAAK